MTPERRWQLQWKSVISERYQVLATVDFALWDVLDTVTVPRPVKVYVTADTVSTCSIGIIE